MEQDKQKILSDLYAIRATMSLIAENDEKNAEPERQAIQHLEDQQWHTQYEEIPDSKKRFVDTLSQRKKNSKARMEQLRTERERKLSELRMERERKEQDYNFRKRLTNHSFASCLWETLWDHSKVGCLLGVILVIMIIVSVALCFILGGTLSDWADWAHDLFTSLDDQWSLNDYWSGVLITAIICFAIICAYFFGICISTTVSVRIRRKLQYKRSEAEFQQANRRLYAESQRVDPELTNATEIYEAYNERVGDVNYSWESPTLKNVNVVTHYNAEIFALVQAHESEVADLEKKIENLELQKEPHNDLLKSNGEKVSAIVESATKAYPLIDLRDWENVDLLIFYFETGRADNMKEALQLVDRQRQTEILAKAVAMASAEISKTIHQSMNRLGNALSQSFSLLSSQMAKQHGEILKGMEEQTAAQLKEIRAQTAAQQAASEAQLKEIRAQTAAQLSSQEMNRALLEKISESSSDLAEQMRRQMREVHGIPV